jgi:hypothetical protein
MFGMSSGENNMATALNVETNTMNATNVNSNANQTTKPKGFLSRLNKKSKEEEMQMIQRNVDNSMKINSNDIVNPGEMNIKSSMFFRLHVAGLIESANVRLII